ncbi:MAG: xylose isomerase [Lentisphaerae bacterium RIFOXYB12_FULL_65_16]|nr:MAG: xylose isomerase [Lentisphaerae bacterium RIFOXYA12_64_32]OGV93723.1 MAG: xylose isomerase [Lentisphaerae bacterium RIFOXYB12_FULL_65_16]
MGSNKHQGTFRFSFGPWNIHQGADPFGPTVRKNITFAKKLTLYKQMGFDGVQFHDDDAVPKLNDMTAAQIRKEATAVKKALDGHGLQAEFVAPRLWEDPRTIDGGYTSNSAAEREYALDRSRKTIDIARALGTRNVVLWLAREGTYVREAKDSVVAVERLAAAVQMMLDYDPKVRILIESKPNEPMDHTYIPTIGHAIALGLMTNAPERVGCLIESAHALLAGLDPSDEMGYAMAQGKLWSVHLNDQNGMKFDQDKTFGSVDLRRAFNQVRILDRHGYGNKGEWIGLDVKAMRSQKDDVATKHLRNSQEIFLKLLEVSRSLDNALIDKLIAERDYEELELLIVSALMGD